MVEGRNCKVESEFRERFGDAGSIPEISAELDFSGSSFENRVNFENFYFPNQTQFSGCEFKFDVWFEFSEFAGPANLRSTRFFGDAGFHRVRFDNVTNFSNAKFQKEVWFDWCHFAGQASFQNLVCGDRFWFENATFVGDLRLQGSRFAGISNFRRAEFGGRVNLSECQFEMATFFWQCQFTNHYPDMTGTALNRITQFSAENFGTIEFQENGETVEEERTFWPQSVKSNHTDSDAARNSCSIIRHAMGQQGRPEDEHFFYRKEMAFAARIGGIWKRMPYALFGRVSDFGYSIKKPSVMLVVLWALGFVAFWGYLASCCVPPPPKIPDNPMFTAMGISFGNVLPIFGVGALFSDAGDLGDFPNLLIFVAMVQKIFGFVFLFFLGLGLRTRFRLR